MPAIPAHFRAAVLMLGSTVLFALMVVAIRLASATLHTFEIAFFRNFFGLLAAAPLILRHGPGFLKTTQFPRYLFRCVIGICSMLAGFWAIGHLPLAQAVSLSYSTPLFVTLAAAAMLNERVRARRWTAVVLGFVGVLVIVRPGTAEFTADAMIAVLAAVMSALVAIQIKQLSQVDKADTIVFWTYALWVPMSLLPALLDWRWPLGVVWLWLAAIGILGTGGQLFWTRALKLGEVSALTPISFMQLPIVGLFGWLLFEETLDAWTVAGTLVILGSNAYIAHREATLARRAASGASSSAAKPGE